MCGSSLAPGIRDSEAKHGPKVEQVESWARSQQIGYEDCDELLRSEKVMEFLEDA